MQRKQTNKKLFMNSALQAKYPSTFAKVVCFVKRKKKNKSKRKTSKFSDASRASNGISFGDNVPLF